MVLALLILSLLLCGCTSRTEAQLYALREQYSKASFTFSAEAEALSEDAVWKYSASVSSSPEDGSMTLSLPERLQGVSVRWGREYALSYDGVILALPTLSVGDFSPAELLPLFSQVLREGYLFRYRQDREGVTAFYSLDEGRELAIRYDISWAPVFIEYYEQGERRLYAIIKDFELGTD